MAGIVVVAILVAVLLVLFVEVSVTRPPKFTPSTLNCIAPVGAPLELVVALVTVAVKVTDCPKTDGLSEERTAVVVPAAVTD